ncbi:MAG TPA: ribonuclease R [Roseiarcus sp.]|nr:ribonuclease R [Roseiarcus sp.]
MKRSSPRPPSRLPSREDLIAFIRDRSGNVSPREIAKAYGAKNADRAALNRMLRELADDGHIDRRRKRLHHAGTLPPVVLADITGRDADGEFLARPTEWDEEAHGAPPVIRIATPRRARQSPRSHGEAGGVGDRALIRIERAGDNEFTGRVIKLIDRAKHRTLGIFRALPAGGGRLVPIDKKALGRELNIAPGATASAVDGDLVAIDVTRHGRFGLPAGTVVERLGSIKSERAVSLIAIHAHDIPHVFPRAVLDEAQSARAATMDGREDWRHVAFVTIDPPDAKDHDDAVHAVPDPDPKNAGGHIVTVAIADVACYVRPGTPLDREAVKRGNSVYFPDRVVPMLPERISNDLCSLRPSEDRPALAVRMVIGRDGRKRSHTFHRVMIRSIAKLHYEQAQLAVSGRPDEDTEAIVERVLEPLYAAYRTVLRARAERSPLDLDLPERKIVLKSDGTVDRVIMPQRLESHKLIEEFMILANVAAAESCEKARVPLIYRVHDEPSPEKLNALREFLATIDINLPKGGALRPEQFNAILDRVKGHAVERLVNEVVLRSQAQAEYSPENFGHFGLNLRRYAHFTSPIRRYADLVVHRALIRTGGLGTDGLPEGIDLRGLAEVSANISATERRAMKAERETSDRLIAHHLADRVGATFDGHVSGVTRAGLFVELDETGADGFIPARFIGDEYFRFDEPGRAFTSSSLTYRLGDPVTVELVEAAPVAGALRFALIGHAGAVPQRPLHQARPRPKSARRDRTRRARRK